LVLQEEVFQAVPEYLKASGRMLRRVRKNDSIVSSI